MQISAGKTIIVSRSSLHRIHHTTPFAEFQDSPVSYPYVFCFSFPFSTTVVQSSLNSIQVRVPWKACTWWWLFNKPKKATYQHGNNLLRFATFTVQENAVWVASRPAPIPCQTHILRGAYRAWHATRGAQDFLCPFIRCDTITGVLCQPSSW